MTRQGETTGFVLVPRVATRAMCIAAAERADIPLTPKGAAEFWTALLAASPEQPASEAMGLRSFLDTVRHMGPNGECVVVRAHPNGDWTVYDPASRNAPKVAERSTRVDGEALAKFDAGACKVGWMRDRLPEAAVRIDEKMPPRGELVVGWISDPAVSIWFYPAFVRFDGHCFWGGVPGNWMSLPDKRWAVTHWHPLALAHPAESANCPVGGEHVAGKECLNCGGFGHTSCDCPRKALPPAGAGDVGYARGVEDAAKVAADYAENAKQIAEARAKNAPGEDGIDRALICELAGDTIAERIRALSPARKDAQ